MHVHDLDTPLPRGRREDECEPDREQPLADEQPGECSVCGGDVLLPSVLKELLGASDDRRSGCIDILFTHRVSSVSSSEHPKTGLSACTVVPARTKSVISS